MHPRVRLDETQRYACLGLAAPEAEPKDDEPAGAAAPQANPLSFLGGAFAGLLFGAGDVWEDEGAGEADADAEALLLAAARGEEKALAALGDAAYWQIICSSAGINDDLNYGTTPQQLEAEATAAREAYKSVGYFTAEPPSEGGRSADAACSAQAVKAVTAAGWPPVFALVYDAPWRLLCAAAGLADATGILGKAPGRLEPSAFIWALQPQPPAGAGEVDAAGDGGPGRRGFGLPHRDYSYHEAHDAATGEANILNLWVALTDATVDSGCLWLVPRPLDAHYDKPEAFAHTRAATPADHVEPGQVRVRFKLGAVRPASVRAGGVVGWCNVIHFGGACSPWVAEPRMSVAMTMKRRGTAGTHLDDAALEELLEGLGRGELPMAHRLRLIAKSILLYKDWYSLAWEEFGARAHEMWTT